MITGEDFKVQLYNENDKGKCFARLIFSDGETLDGITVLANQANSFSVYMPRTMGSTWTCNRVSWEQAKDAVSEFYRKKHTITFDFKTIKRFKESCASVRFLDTGEVYDKVLVSVNSDDTDEIHISFSPRVDDVTFQRVEKDIKIEFFALAFGDERVGRDERVEISFDKIDDVATCFADMHLPGSDHIYKSFKIKRIGTRKSIEFTVPKTLGVWKHNEYDLETIKEAAKSAFFKEYREKFPDDKDEIPESSSLRFFPRTVLRPIKEKEESFGTKGLQSVAVAMSKGEIGPLETNILVWIEKLRYATVRMLQGLVESGHIFVGDSGCVTDTSLNKALTRMKKYSLCDLTHFVSLDDKGYIVSEQKSRIVTLGTNGNSVLHEMNERTHFNAFDILRDGNTVKRFLCANQWLVYFLKKYRNRIDENFDPAYVLYEKGQDYTGARIYSTVFIDSVPFTAEPVRRCEDFEYESDKAWLCEKLTREIRMFSNPDHLYNDKGEVSFKVRPVICIVCEDDAHVDETYEKVSEVLKAYPEQRVIFTTDLRVYNEMDDSERFFTIVDGQKSSFDIDKYIDENR